MPTQRSNSSPRLSVERRLGARALIAATLAAAAAAAVLVPATARASALPRPKQSKRLERAFAASATP